MLMPATGAQGRIPATPSCEIDKPAEPSASCDMTLAKDQEQDQP